jgi:hypothetical protein
MEIHFSDPKGQINTGYFTSDNEPDGNENATHNAFAKVT